MFRRQYCDEQDKTLGTMSTLADVCLTKKKYPEAEALLRSTLAVRDHKTTDT